MKKDKTVTYANFALNKNGVDTLTAYDKNDKVVYIKKIRLTKSTKGIENWWKMVIKGLLKRKITQVK